MNSNIDVQFAADEQHISSEDIKRWIIATLKKNNTSGHIAVRIVDEQEMTSLNHRYRNKEKPTNVLSFACQLPPNLRHNMLGDIVICNTVLAKEAQEQNKSLTAHWSHIVVHGVLHLLGHDHENETDATKMEALEIIILKEFGFANPYGVEKNHE